MAALASDLPLRDTLQAAIEVEMLELSPSLPGYILCEMRAGPERPAAVMDVVAQAARLRDDVFAPMHRQIDALVADGWLRRRGAHRDRGVDLAGFLLRGFAACPPLLPTGQPDG